MERPSPPPPKPSIITAIALIVVGLVVFVPSGLCTGFLALAPIIASLSNPKAGHESGLAGIALVVGGPFVIGGGVLLWIGIKNLFAYFQNSRAPDQF